MLSTQFPVVWSVMLIAVSDGWQVVPLLHNWDNEEPILLKVLFNRVLGTGLTGVKTLSNSSLSSSLRTVAASENGAPS
jgi:hypothetical protein